MEFVDYWFGLLLSGLAGRITSGGYGHTLKKVIALAYIDVINAPGDLESEILGQRYRVWIIADSPYDPDNLAHASVLI